MSDRDLLLNQALTEHTVLRLVQFGPGLLKHNEFMTLLYIVERSVSSADKQRGAPGISPSAYDKAIRSLITRELLQSLDNGNVEVQWSNLREFLK